VLLHCVLESFVYITLIQRSPRSYDRWKKETPNYTLHKLPCAIVSSPDLPFCLRTMNNATETISGSLACREKQSEIIIFFSVTFSNVFPIIMQLDNVMYSVRSVY